VVKITGGILLAFVLAPVASDQIFHYTDPFDLKVDEVHSLGPDQKVGFSHVPHVYAVEATNIRAKYTLYCTRIAPESGHSYKAQEDFVTGNFSFLHLWPVDRREADLYLPPKGPQLYRVVVFKDILIGKQPDMACDVYKKTPLV
jgi:hypothetical protein